MLDLHWEADDHKAICWEQFELMQFLQMAVPPVSASFVPFPNERRIFGLPVLLSGVDKWGIPAPCICSGEPYPTFKQIHRRLIAHPAACGQVVLIPVARSGACVHQDNLQRVEFMVNPLE